MADKIISWAFYILFFFTPLFFTPYTNELFEYNKMFLVYGLTIIIVGVWIIKSIRKRSFTIARTPLDIPILLFLASQILSTVFSIDRHTSIWGYPSRLNGGLLSIISYLLLYYSFISNFTKEDIFKFLRAALLGGLAVSLYAIPEHFGVSPSCAILVQRFSADCWVQDVQARVFATLGQPNWLAAYLAMLIFPALYFFLTATRKFQQAFFYFLLLTFYLAFTFTYSRGASLGFLAGLGIFLIGYLFCHPEGKARRIYSSLMLRMTNIKPVGLVILTFLTINLLFGSALTGDFRLIKKSAPPPRPSLITSAPASTTQLETGGTESSQIRLIVWKGAMEIFKHYPVFGSGVETFAYSYYNFRPKEHNNVSEWDFLYNKAHNEYLNYLATTGLVGLASYSIIFIIFIIRALREFQASLILRKLKDKNSLLLIALLASYLSYLTQNFFGFSVVSIAILFYLIPAFAFVATDSIKLYTLHFTLYTFFSRPLYSKAAFLIILFIVFSLELGLVKFWLADTFYRRGNDYQELGNAGRAYNFISDSVALNSGEPLYISDLGYAASAAWAVLASKDATASSKLKDEALYQTEKALTISPRNVSLHRTAIRTYYNLSLVDQKFESKTVEALDRTIALAPTDAKLYYNKALVLAQIGKVDEAIEAFKQTLSLRPKYFEAYLGMGTIYKEQGKLDEAKKAYQEVLKIVPNEPEALKKLEEIK